MEKRKRYGNHKEKKGKKGGKYVCHGRDETVYVVYLSGSWLKIFPRPQS